jgi:hypothetical protein
MQMACARYDEKLIAQICVICIVHIFLFFSRSMVVSSPHRVTVHSTKLCAETQSTLKLKPSISQARYGVVGSRRVTSVNEI